MSPPPKHNVLRSCFLEQRPRYNVFVLKCITFSIFVSYLHTALCKPCFSWKTLGQVFPTLDCIHIKSDILDNPKSPYGGQACDHQSDRKKPTVHRKEPYLPFNFSIGAFKEYKDSHRRAVAWCCIALQNGSFGSPKCCILSTGSISSTLPLHCLCRPPCSAFW